MRAKSTDRRALSPDDVDELLGVTRERKPKEYDPTFWSDFAHEVRVAGRRHREFIVSWRVRKDLKFLRKYGWYPAGEGAIWVQLAEDLYDDRLVLTLAWKKRLLQSCELMRFLARANLAMVRIQG